MKHFLGNEMRACILSALLPSPAALSGLFFAYDSSALPPEQRSELKVVFTKS
jgi:hypothetical protein